MIHTALVLVHAKHLNNQRTRISHPVEESASQVTSAIAESGKNVRVIWCAHDREGQNTQSANASAGFERSYRGIGNVSCENKVNGS